MDIDFGKTHRIIDLYKLLPTTIQTKIKENVHFPNDKPENFELIMEEISNSFIFLRYVHERQAIVSNWGGLSAIAESIMKVAKETIEKD